MIRLTFLTLFISFLSVYAWKDWYKSLCGLIILMAVVEHPDMPKSIMGIQGLNPWNILLLNVFLAWVNQRKKEDLTWDMPSHINVLLFIYLSVILIGFFRMFIDREVLSIYSEMAGDRARAESSSMGLVSEYIVNSFKWAIPGVLLFDGCRSRERFNYGLFALLGIYFLLGIQIIKWMPISSAFSGDSLTERSLKILLNEVGYHRVNLSMMLSGASWAIISLSILTKNRNKIILIGASGLIVLFAQALTGGRTGYVTWAAVGGVLGLFRWRKFLFLAPVMIITLILIVPGVKDRMTQGFSPESRDVHNPLAQSDGFSDSKIDIYTITAGRNVAWPYVIEKINEAPFLGHGRLAMLRTGISFFLWEEFHENFPHPHNAYLQLLLDNGWIGAIPIFILFFIFLKYSLSLLCDKRDPIFTCIGGVTFSLIFALLVSALGSQSFYPREGSVGMWCAIGLMFRVFVQRSKAYAATRNSRPNIYHSLRQNIKPKTIKTIDIWNPA